MLKRLLLQDFVSKVQCFRNVLEKVHSQSFPKTMYENYGSTGKRIKFLSKCLLLTGQVDKFCFKKKDYCLSFV